VIKSSKQALIKTCAMFSSNGHYCILHTGNRKTDLLDAFSNTDDPYGDCMLSMSA